MAGRKKAASSRGMKWKTLGSGNTWQPEKSGEQLTGNYIGSRATKTQYGKTYLHSIQVGKETVDVWDSFAVAVLRLLPKKCPVRITFKGVKKGKGGKTFKQFEVQVPESVKLKKETPF